jgi:3-phosphoshikimate 1-carboxyvinyltransferase
MASIKVKKLRQVPTEIAVPGDKSISHRSVMFAAMAKGRTVIKGFLSSEDCICTTKAMIALGAKVDILEEIEGIGPVTLAVTGNGMKLQEPSTEIDCGNSGTTTRLLAGILAGQPFTTTLTGDASLSKRPMKRVADPLSLMGAKVEGQGDKLCAPLKISGGELQPITYRLPMASAQVKSAVLLAGLFAPGKTSIVEPIQTRDHTERLMTHFGIKWLKENDTVSVYGGQEPQPVDITVPGDISSAAFWMVAAAAIPDAQITLTNVGLNPTRTGIISVLLRMGAQITSSEADSRGEVRGNVIVKGCDLHCTVIGGAEIPNVIDELPILAVAGALAHGTTRICDAAELRVKETDRIAAVADNLRRMGVTVTEFDDGMEIVGGAKLQGATIDSFGDHRIAMAFAIAGLFAEGVTTINDTECISTSYPGFQRDLDRFFLDPKDQPTAIPVIRRIPKKMGLDTLPPEDLS